jgi:hypothetical protein
MTKEEILHYFISLPEWTEYTELLGEEYDDDIDYAGPRNNKVLDFMIPSTMYGINMNPIFFQHDALYEKGGSKKERFKADAKMIVSGLFIIEKWPDSKWIWGLNWCRRALARRRLIKYFEGVREQGYKSFNFKDSSK